MRALAKASPKPFWSLSKVEAAAQHERQLVLQDAAGGAQFAGVAEAAAQQAGLAIRPAVAELGEVEHDQAQPADMRRQVLDRIGVGKRHRGPGRPLLPVGERQRLEDGGAPLLAKQRHNSLLEGLGADAPIGVDEALAVTAIVEIGRHHGVDGLDHLVGGHRRPEDRADRRLAEVDVAAQAQLVELDPVLVDAEDADVADVMMAAGIDAARDLDLQVADVVLAREPAKWLEMRCATGIERALASAQ